MADEIEGFNPKTINPPVQGGTSRPRLSKLNFLLLVGVIIIGMFLYKAEQQRREVAKKLEETNAQLETVRSSAGTERGDAEVAQEVLAKVRRHIVVPESPPPTVATIVDIESLKKANIFYNSADNGDYLVITERRALLYDPDQDVVLDVVPVRTGAGPGEPGADIGADSNSDATPSPRAGAPRPAPAAARSTPSPAASP